MDSRPLPEGLDLAELKRVVSEAIEIKERFSAMGFTFDEPVNIYDRAITPEVVLRLLSELETSLEAAKEARHRAEVAEAAAALMAEQRDRLQARLETAERENDELRAADRVHLSAKQGMERRLTATITRLQAQLASRLSPEEAAAHQSGRRGR